MKGHEAMGKGRLVREERTMQALIGLWCRNRHGTRENICPDCGELLIYARKRLEKCPFGGQKPTCSRCPVHCYKPLMRERIREVMRYAGPRLLQHHPLLALYHLLDGLRRPEKKGAQGKP